MDYCLKNGPCGSELAFGIVGSRGKPRILSICYNNVDVTFQKLKTELPEIPESTLTRQLNALIQDGMIKKNACKQYSVTQKTFDIMPSLTMLNNLSHSCGYIENKTSSSIEYAKRIIGTKWKSRIIWLLHKQGSVRFNTIQNSIEDLSHKVLKQQLDDLMKFGLVVRYDFGTKDPHVEYKLTEKGEYAYQIIDSLADWCIQYDLIHPTITISY